MTSNSKEALGERLRIAREAAKLTQSELGRRAGVTPQSVNQWESGLKSPSRENLLRVAKETLAPLHWLLYGGQLPEQDANGSFVSDDTRGTSYPC